MVLYKPNSDEIIKNSEELRDDIKEPKETNKDTARFANVEKNKICQMNLKETSKSIKKQVEFLSKSILNRQQAKLKEEQRLEEDMLKLADEYKEVW